MKEKAKYINAIFKSFSQYCVSVYLEIEQCLNDGTMHMKKISASQSHVDNIVLHALEMCAIFKVIILTSALTKLH